MPTRCRECRVVVQANYDHVSPWCPDKCSGTYAHPPAGRRSSPAQYRCKYQLKDVNHHLVENKDEA